MHRHGLFLRMSWRSVVGLSLSACVLVAHVCFATMAEMTGRQTSVGLTSNVVNPGARWHHPTNTMDRRLFMGEAAMRSLASITAVTCFVCVRATSGMVGLTVQASCGGRRQPSVVAEPATPERTCCRVT